jgi:hypothetical protein
MSAANIDPNLFHQKRGLVTKVEAALEEQVLDITQRQREPNLVSGGSPRWAMPISESYLSWVRTPYSSIARGIPIRSAAGRKN